MNNYQQQQQQQQHQQHQHQHALHQMQRQNVHQQFPPQHTQYMYSDPTTAPAPRTDGFTVFRTTHGDYLMNNYNNYELFSNNAFIPPHHAMQQPPHSQQPPPPPPPQQPSQEHAFYHANNLTMGDRYMTDANNTNFINSLVDNWIPNMTGMPFGEYTPFGESPLPPQNMSSTHNVTAPISNANEIREDLTNKESSSNSSISSISAPIINNDPDMKNGNVCNENIGSMKINSQMSADCKEAFIQTNNLHAMKNAQASCTNGNFQCDNTNPIKPTSDVKKPRMVAEVKPMRMSYSDVLSKNVFIKDDLSEANTFANRNSGGANNFANGLANANPLQKSSKTDKTKNSINASDKKSANVHDDIKDYSANFKGTKTPANSTTVQNSAGIKSSSSFDGDSKPTDIDGKQSKKKTSANVTNGKTTNRTTKNASTEFLSKRRSQTDLNVPPTKDDSDKNSSPNNNGYFYNITKNEPSNADKPFPSYTKTSQRKNASSKSFSTAATSSRSNLPRTEKSTVYQQKRSSKSRKNNTYEFILKLAHTWFNYMLFFFKWLIALVADVFMLSIGIILDHFSAVYDYSCQMFSSLRSELTNNSGRPYAYFISLWQKFDNKFSKDSKWAVWRRLFSKKKPPETIPDYYKNGRLPQTGDEAMYSLLNCKGKDAYSILGVQSDCSQEQIRKHYKKIAVLVHPDKNKQPGAEEAFKILQRAFELIGEPENRKSYDQGVAEALNAEKAWSELNDLLKQLQTKIAEAVNTIRCSSCGLRHPRKPTGRPHYAARQCNQCKIRHTAREGDIWAESDPWFFGLRWKYLALMEGKVLDITEWANCQKGALSHLQPNSHIVQYRIVLGGQQQQQQQNQQPHYQQEKERLKREQTTEPSLDDFLDNLYSGQNPQNPNAGGNGAGSRRRNRKN
ncbi:dnaJ homolog dnj-5 isoform X3 [Sitodiplosis mosellana]|uniref:dnaJ homolog dnj-5 isoform X3 n=1 Tax=Sitodiplosis mosellana TaxID=263140 RepID=UPI002443B665|nr:dnaJ homolog dnj-5 isoform X3 [Sitodiplosis mosellana]